MLLMFFWLALMVDLKKVEISEFSNVIFKIFFTKDSQVKLNRLLPIIKRAIEIWSLLIMDFS
jgi:hypothetical protein